MATVSKLLHLAALDAGIVGNGQSLNGEDTETMFDTLQQMLALWRTDDLEVYCHKNLNVQMTGALTYTIGAGGVVDTDRPPMIEQAIFLDGVNTTSYPLSIIRTLEDWQRIAVKVLPGQIPVAIRYEPTFPLGTLYVWPQPAAGVIQLTVKQPFPIYQSLGDDLVLPPEYEAPIRFNLAKWAAAAFSTPLRPDIAQLAAGTLKQLKRANIKIRELEMPERLPLGNWIDGFNVYTDQP